ncbi:HNH endonuclease [Neobacillus niacini]|uniref:HNH endonuclease n=1 Tax=Neobacillus niacini TaxID=86668 RepID=UPI00069350D3|nr:HNH endonuclease [Neobacillus niacini]
MRTKICSGCGKRIPYTATCQCKKRVRNKATEGETDKLMKSSRWKKLRLRVLDRDGGYCQRCLIKFGIIETANMTVHHIKNRRDYPELIFDESNLCCLCRTCNSQLGTKELDFNWKAPQEDEREFVL